MAESLPDPRLRRVLEQLDATKRELMRERMRSSQLKRRVAILTAQKTTDAAVKLQDRRPGC